MYKRRDFLKTSAFASTAWFVPSFIQQGLSVKPNSSRTGKILVIVQFSGGNDGLNTIIPFEDDIYFQNRPSLAIPKEEVLQLGDYLGFNPAMEALRSLYDDGKMTILNSVGYPNPDRSHFRSMDIWHTASDSDTYLQSGWLGRYLDHACSGCDQPYTAIEIDDTLSLALKGKDHNGFAMSNPKQLKKTTKNPFLQKIGQEYDGAANNEAIHYLYKTMIQTQESADYLSQKVKAYRSNVTYPATGFGKDLKQIAELITTDTDTKIYYVSITGFDTHANQKNVQSRLLKQYADGMKAFVSDLTQHGLLDETLIMTFSEFGRRVKQNASGGTDHGAANNLFLIGGKLKQPGFYNQGPDLSNLLNGDVRHQIDFRSVYTELLDNWLDVAPNTVLDRKFERLGVV